MKGSIFPVTALPIMNDPPRKISVSAFCPFNHVFGQIHIMNATILSSGCLELLPSFDMERVLEILEAGRVTKFFSVPTVYIRLLTLARFEEKAGEAALLFFGRGRHGDGDR